MRSMPRPLSIAKVFLFACAWASAAVGCLAQQTTPSGTQGQTPVFTLKVYADLVQVPTLVLDHDLQPLPPINPKRFQVSLDGGKKFAPTHVRVEGEDPLDLGILVDASDKQDSDFMGMIGDAVATMAAKSLHAQDHVWIYAVNCGVLRTMHQAAADPQLLRTEVQELVQPPKLGKNSGGAPCGTKVYLGGALAAVVNDMKNATGRRSILTISSGRDDGTPIPWDKLHEYAAGQGVALFGLTPGSPWTGWQRDPTNVFRALCESTGGILVDVDKHDLEKQLQNWVKLLRGRYVVEFPRPQQLSEARHDIQVSIKRDGLAFVTLAGVSVSLPDPKLTSDPNFVPSQEGADIPVGKRRPMPD